MSFSRECNKHCSGYWFSRLLSERYFKRAHDKRESLKELRSICSAQETASVQTTVGTTAKALRGALSVRFENRLRKDGWNGFYLSCWLEREVAGRKGVVCLLASVVEDYYNDLESRWSQECIFWRQAIAKLEGIPLSPARRKEVEAQIALTVRRPAQDEIEKYDAKEAAFVGGSKKMGDARREAEKLRWQAAKQARAARTNAA